MVLKTDHTPTGGSNRESLTMDESLITRRRVWDEGLRVVNHLIPREIEEG